ncbi:MAG: HD-GYP domain-containing protein [Candidatus Xenobiia bacterium LiM19]
MENERSYISTAERIEGQRKENGTLYRDLRNTLLSDTGRIPPPLEKAGLRDLPGLPSLCRNSYSDSPKAYVIAVKDTLEHLFDSIVNLDAKEKMGSLFSFCSFGEKAEFEARDRKISSPTRMAAEETDDGTFTRREQITDLLRELLSPESPTLSRREGKPRISPAGGNVGPDTSLHMQKERADKEKIPDGQAARELARDPDLAFLAREKQRVLEKGMDHYFCNGASGDNDFQEGMERINNGMHNQIDQLSREAQERVDALMSKVQSQMQKEDGQGREKLCGEFKAEMEHVNAEVGNRLEGIQSGVNDGVEVMNDDIGFQSTALNSRMDSNDRAGVPSSRNAVITKGNENLHAGTAEKVIPSLLGARPIQDQALKSITHKLDPLGKAMEKNGARSEGVSPSPAHGREPEQLKTAVQSEVPGHPVIHDEIRNPDSAARKKVLPQRGNKELDNAEELIGKVPDIRGIEDGAVSDLKKYTQDTSDNSEPEKKIAEPDIMKKQAEKASRLTDRESLKKSAPVNPELLKKAIGTSLIAPGLQRDNDKTAPGQREDLNSEVRTGIEQIHRNTGERAEKVRAEVQTKTSEIVTTILSSQVSGTGPDCDSGPDGRSDERKIRGQHGAVRDDHHFGTEHEQENPAPNQETLTRTGAARDDNHTAQHVTASSSILPGEVRSSARSGRNETLCPEGDVKSLSDRTADVHEARPAMISQIPGDTERRDQQTSAQPISPILTESGKGLNVQTEHVSASPAAETHSAKEHVIVERTMKPAKISILPGSERVELSPSPKVSAQLSSTETPRIQTPHIPNADGAVCARDDGHQSCLRESVNVERASQKVQEKISPGLLGAPFSGVEKNTLSSTGRGITKASLDMNTSASERSSARAPVTKHGPVSEPLDAASSSSLLVKSGHTISEEMKKISAIIDKAGTLSGDSFIVSVGTTVSPLPEIRAPWSSYPEKRKAACAVESTKAAEESSSRVSQRDDRKTSAENSTQAPASQSSREPGTQVRHVMTAEDKCMSAISSARETAYSPVITPEPIPASSRTANSEKQCREIIDVISTDLAARVIDKRTPDDPAKIVKVPEERAFILSTRTDMQIRHQTDGRVGVLTGRQTEGVNIRLEGRAVEFQSPSMLSSTDDILDVIHNIVRSKLSTTGEITSTASPDKDISVQEKAGVISIVNRERTSARVPLIEKSFVDRRKAQKGIEAKTGPVITGRHMEPIRSILEPEKMNFLVGGFLCSSFVAVQVQRHFIGVPRKSEPVKGLSVKSQVVDEVKNISEKGDESSQYRSLQRNDREGRKEQGTMRRGKSGSEAQQNETSSREEFMRMLRSIESEEICEELHREEAPRVTEKKELVTRQIQEASKQAATSIESVIKKSMKESWTGDEMAAKLIYMLMKASSTFTFEHSSRVIDLSMQLARQMGITDEQELKDIREGAMFHDIGEAELDLDGAPQTVKDRLARYLTAIDLRNCSFLHDIGKVKIPDSILYKHGRLTDEEYEVLKQHPVIGEQILKPIPSMAHVLPVVRHHHETWDGKGYPDRLEGESIPLAARIVGVTDAFDAMIFDRPYRKGMSVEKAVTELKKNSGTQFDPAIVEAFLKVVEKKFGK